MKYVGSVEGIDEDAVVEDDDDDKPRVVYHFGIEKLNGKRWLFVV